MNNFIKRSISGIVYVAVIVASLFAPPICFAILMAVFALLASYEFKCLTNTPTNNHGLSRVIALLDSLTSVSLCATAVMPRFFVVAPLVIFAYTILRLVLALYDRTGQPLRQIGISFIDLLYVVVPLALAVFIHTQCLDAKGFEHLILLVFIMIWLNDTGAYIVGCSIGRHRLFERLSPKKSWEGFWGGLVFSVLAGLCYWLVCARNIAASPHIISLWFWIGLGAIVSVSATFGDLFESLIKRSIGVKDSGKLIPGHGGILDRIDSLLFAVPSTVLYVTIFMFINSLR